MLKKERKYKVYIYGMGNEYNKLSSYLSLYKNKLEILGIITTKNPPRFLAGWVSVYVSGKNE